MATELAYTTKLFVFSMLVVAALIDGTERRVPNWLTLPTILAGLAFSTWLDGLSGLGWSFTGFALGIAMLVVPYALNAMGAGDVKLMGALGAWVGPDLIVVSFLASAIVGGFMGVAMILWQKTGWQSLHRLQLAFGNLAAFRDLSAEVPGEYRPSTKLPYGIPIAIGSTAVLFLAA